MAEKLAEIHHPIHELLRRRWSPRAFAERSVEPEKLRSLLEAARWAPSSYNQQPWSFLIATQADRAEYDRLLSCLVEGNRAWAKNAPVLILSVAKLRFDHNGKPNRHAIHDVGLAAENLVIQATELGLVVHQMAGFHLERARELFSIPEGYEPVAMIALGYPSESQSRPEGPRERKPLEAFVFGGRWGESSPLVMVPR